MILQGADIGANRDIAAILGAALVDLQPASIAQPHFVGPRTCLGLLRQIDLHVNVKLRAHCHHHAIGRARADRLMRQAM